MRGARVQKVAAERMHDVHIRICLLAILEEAGEK